MNETVPFPFLQCHTRDEPRVRIALESIPPTKKMTRDLLSLRHYGIGQHGPMLKAEISSFLIAYRRLPLSRTEGVSIPSFSTLTMLVLPLKPALRFDLQTALALWLDNSDQQVTFEPANPLQFVVPKPEFSAAACRLDLVRLQSLRNCVSDALLKPGLSRISRCSLRV
jgi:hypothetical protein